VPATPAWTVHDVVAHLTGVAADLMEGRLDGLATDEWTNAQVARSRNLSVVQLLDLWDEQGAAVDAVADSFGAAGGQLLADAASHEHAGEKLLGVDELRAYEWEGDARPELLVFDAVFTPRTASLGE
jgi:hypothetical protein